MVFLILFTGGLFFLYSLFAETVIRGYKTKAVQKTYEYLVETDMEDFLEGTEEEERFAFEEEKIGILICDSAFDYVYSSDVSKGQESVERRIKQFKDHFKKNAKPHMLGNAAAERIVLRGLIEEQGESYYIYIYYNMKKARDYIWFSRKVIGAALVVIWLFAALYFFLYYKYSLKPLAFIQQETKSLDNGELSARICREMPTNELGRIAEDLNRIAEKMYRELSEKENYKYILDNQNEDLDSLNVMQNRVVSNVTHQLKTPLAIISSQLELEFVEKDPEKKEYYLNSIMEEIEKMSGLIRDILQDSRVKGEKENKKICRTNLSEVMAEMVPKYENWLSSQGIMFAYSLDENVYVEIDQSQIEQAVNNYMMNACSHTKQGKAVRLSLEKEEGSCLICVYNEGNGIPKGEMERIWQDRYQKNAAGTGNKMNFGLGLYIVKDIVRQHGGTCGVENVQDGVRFWIRLFC